jgi:hypothetical protein
MNRRKTMKINAQGAQNSRICWNSPPGCAKLVPSLSVRLKVFDS